MTVIVNVQQAKTQLSSLLQRVHQGERVTIARNGVPIADLVPTRTDSGSRRFGFLGGGLSRQSIEESLRGLDEGELKDWYSE